MIMDMLSIPHELLTAPVPPLTAGEVELVRGLPKISKDDMRIAPGLPAEVKRPIPAMKTLEPLA